MLVEFKVSNFRSFRDEAVLSMVPAKDRAGAKMHPHNVYKGNPAAGKAGLLKYAGIIGPNAAGKSNMMRALKAIWKIAIFSLTDENLLPESIQPFRWDDAMMERPSKFSVKYVVDDMLFDYEVHATTRYISYECLKCKRGRVSDLIYRRSLEESNKYVYQYGKNHEKALKALEAMTRPNSSFLAVTSSFNMESSKKALSWFRDSFKFPSELSVLEHYTLYNIHRNNNFKNAVISFLKAADIDIEDISTYEGNYYEYLSSVRGKERIPNELSEKLRNTERVMAKMSHKAIDKANNQCSRTINYEDESEGTRAFLSLVGPLIDVVNNGRCLVVDEIDTSFHTHLTAMIIECFRSEKLNKKGAQLIFTTHDLELLDMDLLRRDQINIVQKVNGASSIYSLWDVDGIDPQRHNIRDRYFVGKYGGIPVIDLPDESVLTGDTEEGK